VEHWFDTSQLQKAAPPVEGPESTGLQDRPNDSSQGNDALKTSSAKTLENESDQGDDSSQAEPLPPPHLSEQVFPKEFNKNYLESLDRRYLIILLLTLVLEPLVIWYLLRTYPSGMDEQEIAKLQSKYVELFLSDFEVETAPGEMPARNELLLRASELIPQIVGETAGVEVSKIAPAVRPEGVNPEARLVPRESREALRKITTLSRQRGLEALSREVERIGLLGVITSGSGMVSYETVTDILEYADSTTWDIDQALSEVTVLRVPRAGVDYFGSAVGGATNRNKAGHGSGEIFLATKEVRGQRAITSGVATEDIINELAEAPQKSIERNRSFEHVAATPSLTGLRARSANGYATRDREQIRELVSAHNPAIQDCYRRQLKSIPTLRGKITIRFTISPSGHVVDAQVYSSSLTTESMSIELPAMEECILSKVRKWRDFGKVDESLGDITLRQTYVFGY
jgi:hypothetical protein